MEVREVYTIEDPTTPGRVLHIHFSEEEFKDVVQAGVFYLLQQGYINFKSIQEQMVDIEIPEGATEQ